MRRAGPLTSWLTNKPARFYMRDSNVSQQRASPAISSHVPSFFCVKLKKTKKYFLTHGAKYDTVRASQAGWPVSSVYMRRVSPLEAGSR